jgi:hypothetical protein
VCVLEVVFDPQLKYIAPINMAQSVSFLTCIGSVFS